MNIVIDVIFVLFLALMFFFGFRKGFLTKAWWLLDIGLIVIFGIFLTPSIKAALDGSLTPALENAFTSMVESSGMNLDPAEFAGIVTSVIIWIGIAIIVIIVMAIIKAVLRRVNKIKFFGFIDKLLGGVYAVAISLAVLVVLGALAGTFVNFDVMKNAADFCSQTYIFKYVFGANPFQQYADQYVPLGTWIAGLIPQS
ncbi:MAG TPA: CvpA family protein [Candidatus Borkfalkia excrementigallinarum]|uniref:CvpA family protein n=1 Tax=Candidatus Borkfalkia excrementigallinarum TaxID=2838506 RepID=A0A9D2CT30_9FIRM|nr:CvpA family protein [Candidatus Borkfalkia excrementigallinarum]